MKTCLRCNVSYPWDAFHSRKHTSRYTGKVSTYYTSYCKACNTQNCKERRQSIPGLYQDAYNGQLKSSRCRGHPPPNYTRKDLQQWFEAQPQFLTLCAAWSKSGYSRWLKPSPDRLDENKPYTLDNLQLVTWGENAKSFKEKRVLNGAGDCKAVQQFLNGALINTYHSLHEAERQTGASAGNILRCCRGEYSTSKKFEWRYADA